MTKILVVDDDPLVLATTALGLQQAGYDALQADNGELAVKIANRELLDLALLDIRMPKLSGFEVAERLSELKIPFVFLSAYGDEEMVEAASKVGALGYLVKPLEIGRIIPALEVALVRAEDISKSEQTIVNLSNTLEKNRAIDIAIGILMERFHINRVASFEKLRNYARSHQTKIIDVAEAVVQGISLDFG